MDFQTNKRVCEEVAIIPSKALKNKIAGYTTHLMKRIQRGPVRGISLKLQEEERERRMDFVPEVSAVDTDSLEAAAGREADARSPVRRRAVSVLETHEIEPVEELERRHNAGLRLDAAEIPGLRARGHCEEQ